MKASPESRRRVQAARQAFRALPRDLRNEMRRVMRAELNPVWRASIKASLDTATPMQREVFKSGTRVEANIPAYLVAGANKQIPTMPRKAAEFGSDRQGRYTRYSRTGRKGGASHTVERRTAAQMPKRRTSGYVVGPALAKALPRVIGSLAASWEKAIYKAIDGR